MALNRISLGGYVLAIIFFVGLAASSMILNRRELGIDPLFLLDFSNYWGGANILFEGDPLSVFNWKHYFPQLVALFGDSYTWHNWSYPPSYLLMCAPLYFMSYHVALAVFLFGTLGLFVFAVHCFAVEHAPDVTAGRSPWANPVFVLLLLAAVLCNMRYAQNGFLTSGLLLLGLAYWNRRPVLAGVFLGLLTIKPQLGILIPFLLLIDRNWPAIVSATLTALVLVAVSGAILGFQAWLDYLQITMPLQSRIVTEFGEDQPYLSMMLSAFTGMRTLGIDGAAAWMVHLLFAVPALILGFWTILRTPDTLYRFTVLVIMTFVVSPYSFTYDASVLSAVCATLALRYRAIAARENELCSINEPLDELRYRLLYFAAVLPIASGLITMLVFPVTPPVLLLALLLISPAAPRLFASKKSRKLSPAE